MENKYYSPTCEDFMYGLEYEYGTPSYGWKKYIFNEDRPPSVLQNVKEFSSMFRVKYLDQSDIESLGWKVDNIYHTRFVKKEFQLYYSFIKEPIIEIYVDEMSLKLAIRNISEFKVLCKQLGI